MGKFAISPDVERLIGYDAWEVLSWTIRCGWVQDYKHLFSEKLHWNVGVPDTVGMMLAPAGLVHWENQARLDYFLSVKDIIGSKVNIFGRLNSCKDIRDFRNLMIEAYLLGTDYCDPLYKNVVPDKDGKNQLEGELIRHCSSVERGKPSDVKLTSEDVHDYCGYHRLRDRSFAVFCDRLKLYS